MRKIIWIAVVAALIISIIATGTVVMAKSNSNSNPSTTIASQDSQGKLTKAQIMKRLLLVQDEAKINDLLAQQVKNGKITQEQADKIKTFWQNNHGKVKKIVQGTVVKRLLSVQDAAKVNDFLTKQVAAGKITQVQADKITAFWQKNHKQ